MDPEPASVSRPSSRLEESSITFQPKNNKGLEDEDPLGLSAPSIALLGLTIALATIGIPIAAVLTERSLGRNKIAPSAMEIDGSETSFSDSFARTSEPGG